MANQEIDQANFQFASYLSTALGTTIAEFVEIPGRAWVAVELLLLGLAYVYTLMEPNEAFGVWVALGWLSGPCLSFVAHAKIRSILSIHCEQHLNDDEAPLDLEAQFFQANRSVREVARAP